MRPIDADALFDFLTEQFDKETGAYSKGRNAGINIARSALHDKTITPAIVPPPNEPLTLEELRQMDGEPVWLKSGDCCLVDVHHWFNPKFEAVAGITKYGKSLILADFVLYRRNPKEEPHEQNKN